MLAVRVLKKKQKLEIDNFYKDGRYRIISIGYSLLSIDEIGIVEVFNILFFR